MKGCLINFNVLVFLPVLGVCQIIDDLPSDSTGKIVFRGLHEIPSLKKDEIYRAFLVYFPNKLNDREQGTVFGSFQNENEVKEKQVQIKCSLKLTCADGGFNYEIFDILFKDMTSGISTRAEEWFDSKSYYDKYYSPKEPNELLKDKLILWAFDLEYSMANSVLKVQK